MSRGRDGVALVVVLTLLLALTALAHGSLVLARAEARAASTVRRATEARLVADGLLASHLAGLQGDTLPALAPGRVDSVVVSADRVVLRERVAGEVYLVGSRVGFPGGGRPMAAERLLWALDPRTRAASVGAVLAVGAGRAGSGAVLSGDFFGSPGGSPGSCPPWDAVLDSLGRSFPLPVPVEALPVGAGGRGGTGALTLGLLGADSLLARLAPLSAGVITPAPAATAGGRCRDAPGNWGSPTGAVGACFRRFVGRGVRGDLVVDGGEGQGVLAVTGDLVVRGAARLDGIVLVGGRLLVTDGSEIRGVTRAGGSAVIDGGATVVGDACPILHALGALAGLRRPVRMAEPLLPLP